MMLDLVLASCAESQNTYPSRQGVMCRGLIGPSFSVPLDRFPLTARKAMPFELIADELLWMIAGDTNVYHLKGRYWDKFSRGGYIGKTYGYQLRHPHFDQLKRIEESIRTDPYSRRHIIILWRVPDSWQEDCFPPCTTQLQFIVRDNRLNLIITQRSMDVFIGGYWNIAQYALFLTMMSRVTSNIPGYLVYTIGDAHIYESHLPQITEYLSRPTPTLPRIDVPVRRSCTEYKVSDFTLLDYNPLSAIKVDEVY